MKDILETAAATIRRHRMLPERGRAVLGVSGGPDSQAMLHVVHELCARDSRGIRLHVAHLHHGMRGQDADEDARFVRDEAARLGMPCTVERADVPALALQRRVGDEVAGRDARYAFLARIARSLGAERVLLGHHADDQAETVLMRAMRGAGPRGMGGIPYVRPLEHMPTTFVVRPLLDCTRAEIEQFLAERGLRSRLDRTNLSSKYLRNRVRASVLPAIEREWGSGLRKSLCALAAAAQRLCVRGAALCDAIERQCHVEVEREYVEAAIAPLLSAPKALAVELFQRWLKAAGLWRKALSSRHYEEIFMLMAASRGAVSVPGEIMASRNADRLIFSRSRRWSDPEYSVEVAVPGGTRVGPLEAALEAEVLHGGLELLDETGSRTSRDEELFDLGKIQRPLAARFYRPGDRMRPLGAPGRRKVQDILTDAHVPRWRRGRVLVVTAGDDLIWIVGVRMADRAKLTPDTRKVLRLRFLQGALLSEPLPGLSPPAASSPGSADAAGS